jgi:ComF family protein
MNRVGTYQRPAYFVYQLFWTSLDWLFPPFCGGCGKLGYRWCETCDEAAQNTKDQYCLSCGAKLGVEKKCAKCSNPSDNRYIIQPCFAYTGPVKNAVHQLKYKKDIGLGDAMAKPMIHVFENLNWKVELLTPVPTGKIRQVDRGYNQAGLIAKPIALSQGIQYCPEAIVRRKETQSQVRLSAESRRINVRDAFQANPQMVSGKSICLVDDVTTTGSTMEACMDALYQAGAECVYGFTFAKAVLNHADLDDRMD